MNPYNIDVFQTTNMSSNKLSFTFYAVNYVTETCIVFMCEYTGSVARVPTTQ